MCDFLATLLFPRLFLLPVPKWIYLEWACLDMPGFLENLLIHKIWMNSTKVITFTCLGCFKHLSLAFLNEQYPCWIIHCQHYTVSFRFWMMRKISQESDNSSIAIQLVCTFHTFQCVLRIDLITTISLMNGTIHWVHPMTASTNLIRRHCAKFVIEWWHHKDGSRY
jgi:hypothetical protein